MTEVVDVGRQAGQVGTGRERDARAAGVLALHRRPPGEERGAGAPRPGTPYILAPDEGRLGRVDRADAARPLGALFVRAAAGRRHREEERRGASCPAGEHGAILIRARPGAFAGALVVACVAVGTAIGAAHPTPTLQPGDAAAAVIALDGPLLAAAQAPSPEPPRDDAYVFRPGNEPGAGTFFTSEDSRDQAIEEARTAAVTHVRRVLRAQDEVLREVVRDEPGTPRADAARALLADPERYSLFYVVDPVPPPASEAAGALRSGLLGLLVALAALALLGRALARGRVAVVALAVGVAAGALDSTRATATLFPALLGLAALAWVLAAGRPTIRALLGIVIVVSPIRGAILAVAEELELPHALVIVNAIQPVLVAVAVAGLLLELRAGRGLRVSRPLALAAAAIAAAALLDLATQQSGASVPRKIEACR
jgi:hypothetical protein